jgi:hypothetical protein
LNSAASNPANAADAAKKPHNAAKAIFRENFISSP